MTSLVVKIAILNHIQIIYIYIYIIQIYTVFIQSHIDGGIYIATVDYQKVI